MSDLSKDDSVGVRAWYEDLSYDEVHSFIVGAFLMYVGLLVLGPLGPATMAGLMAGSRFSERVRGLLVREPWYFGAGALFIVPLGLLTRLIVGI